jgi:hypothetical protein
MAGSYDDDDDDDDDGGGRGGGGWTTTTTTATTPREAIVRTGPSPGDDSGDLAIGILRASQGSYMSRLPLGFALAFDRG